jgi:hypothetical protein
MLRVLQQNQHLAHAVDGPVTVGVPYCICSVRRGFFRGHFAVRQKLALFMSSAALAIVIVSTSNAPQMIAFI